MALHHNWAICERQTDGEFFLLFQSTFRGIIGKIFYPRIMYWFNHNPLNCIFKDVKYLGGPESYKFRSDLLRGVKVFPFSLKTHQPTFF